MLTVESPVDVVDLLALYDPLEGMRRRRLKAVLWQAAYADTVGFRDEAGRLVAVILFYVERDDDEETITELVFHCTPDIVPHLVGFIRLARLTIARMAQSAGHRVRAFVRKGHEPGRRLARLVGLKPAGEHGPLERWEWISG